MPCDGNCFACRRPVSQCHGGPESKTAYTHPSQRPTKKGSGADAGIKKAPNLGRKNGKECKGAPACVARTDRGDVTGLQQTLYV